MKKLKEKSVVIGMVGLGVWAFMSVMVLSISPIANSGKAIGVARRLDDYGDNAQRQVASAKMSAVAAVTQIQEPIRKRKIKKEIKQAKREIKRTQKLPQEVPSAFKEIEFMSFRLTEVYNAKKFKRALRVDEFSGTLDMRDGNIEEVFFSLVPTGEEFSPNGEIALKGNTFEYELYTDDGQCSTEKKCSGVIFYAGNNKDTMIMTLAGGPFDQTRLKFLNVEVEQQINAQTPSSPDAQALPVPPAPSSAADVKSDAQVQQRVQQAEEDFGGYNFSD